jgi:hypothetical protein
VRYTGVSFVFQISSLIFSGLTPMIALLLVRYNNDNPWYLAGYVAATGVVSAAASTWIFMRSANSPGQVVVPASGAAAGH